MVPAGYLSVYRITESPSSRPCICTERLLWEQRISSIRTSERFILLCLELLPTAVLVVVVVVAAVVAAGVGASQSLNFTHIRGIENVISRL